METPTERASKDGRLSLLAGLMVLVVTAAMVLGAMFALRPQPECPSEDSCTATYVEGIGWVITEVIP